MDSKWINLRDRLFFNTTDSTFDATCSEIRDELIRQKDTRLLADMAIDLRSYLMNYVIGNEKGLLNQIARAQAEKNVEALEIMGETELVKETLKEIQLLEDSSLIKLTRLTDEGILNVRWGNDNGLGIMQAMRRGAMLVTTNPPIINMARKAHPEFYGKVRDRINSLYGSAGLEKRVQLLTMNIVLNNCRALRLIYELSGHQLGYVNYQVNPHNYGNADAMIDEIYFAYDYMAKELGGKPNVVFKVPGTEASLKTVEMATKKGIGVTVTVNFSVSQSYEFSKRIQEGSADKSYIVIMAGRLDGPVAEDLEKAGIPDFDLLSREASRAVTQAVYNDVILKNGFTKSEILVASLRGPWNINASLTSDHRSRIMISAFPDKAAEYDGKVRDYAPLVQQKILEDQIILLEKSDVFHKAYHFNSLKPDMFDTYKPVVDTLNSFIKVYDELKAYMDA